MNRRKKSGFLTFCFSLIPGAGEMYLGFMKMGVSLMGLFFAVIVVGGFLNVASVMLIDVIVWFYSFFHVHNLAGMPDEEFLAVEDEFLFRLDEVFDMGWKKEKYRKIVAVIMIAAGILLLWNGWKAALRPWIPYFLFDMISRFENTAPRILAGIAIIFGGIHMIKGKREEMEEVIIDIDANDINDTNDINDIRKENSSGNKAREAETGFMPIVEAERKGYGTETERKDS